MKTKIITTLILGFVLTGCGSTQPDWVDKPAEQYPQQRYLSAVGEADDRNTADGRALANLAKIFEVAIKDSSLDFSRAQAVAHLVHEDMVEVGVERDPTSIFLCQHSFRNGFQDLFELGVDDVFEHHLLGTLGFTNPLVITFRLDSR